MEKDEGVEEGRKHRIEKKDRRQTDRQTLLPLPLTASPSLAARNQDPYTSASCVHFFSCFLYTVMRTWAAILEKCLPLRPWVK